MKVEDKDKFRACWRKSRIKNREKILVRNRERYNKNREKYQLGNAVWARNNPEKTASYKKRYYEANKEAAKQRAILWNREHKKRRSEINKKHNSSHKEEIAERAATYGKQNKKKITDYARQWRKINPHKVLATKHRRRAREANCETGDNRKIETFIRSVKSKRMIKCYYCERSISTKKIHFDHIVPLFRGGKNNVENLAVSCPNCNNRKYIKTIKEWNRNGQQLFAI